MKIFLHKALKHSPRHYSSYWSCSKFADWLRGNKKPDALEMDAWDSWHKESQSANKFRYWLSEDFLDGLQYVLYTPYNLYKEAYYALNARFWDCYWQVDTGLNRWSYHDPDARLESAAFKILQDYVETRGYDFIKEADCAPSTIGGKEEFSYHAKQSIQILEIYDWYQQKDERQERLERQLDACYEGRDASESWFEDYDELEQAFEQEITDKLVDLIKLRKVMWH